MIGSISERRVHWGDALLARLAGEPSIFAEGFGNHCAEEHFKRIVLTDEQEVVDIRLTPSKDSILGKHAIGNFVSTATELPPEFRQAVFELITPRNREIKGHCIMLPALGDSRDILAKLIAWPLLRAGVAVILPRVPFYSSRNINGISNFGLEKFSNQLYMAGAVVSETRSIIHWLHANNKRVALAGYSMGGVINAYTLSGLKYSIPAALGATAFDPSKAVFGGLLANKIIRQSKHEGFEEELRQSMGRLSFANFPVPEDCSQITLIACMKDGLIAPEEVQSLHRHWQGSKLLTLNAGHASGMFRSAIPIKNAVLDAFSEIKG